MATENPVTLTNGSVSYTVYINEAGYLETVYFGPALAADTDFSCVRNGGEDATRVYDMRRGEERLRADGFMEHCAPLEVSTHGLLDKRGAPVVVRAADGTTETDFRYVGHRRFAGAHVPEGLPHMRGEACETLEFSLRDAASGVLLRLYLTLLADKDVLVKSFSIENAGARPVRILRAMSMQLDLPSDDYDLVHFKGRWAKERDWCEERLPDGVREIFSNSGRSSAEENPFVVLRKRGTSWDSGEALGFHLIYSGNFKFRTYTGPYGGVHVTYGINDEDFDWLLSPGAVFETPQAALCYSRGGMDGMSAAAHRFVRENVLAPCPFGAYRPVLFNSWEGCLFNFDTQRILSYIDDACKLGSELFVLDDGWFSTRSDDTSGLGDWTVNRNKIDLHAVMAHCRARGLKFGIWFEPEMVNYRSALFAAHPEYALGYTPSRTELSLMRHQLHLDFTDPAVVEEIYGQMKAFLEEYPVDYIKWDYNRTVAEHTSARLPADRRGEVYHRLTLGYYALIGRITREYPHIFIEGCASGGGRFDLGTLYYCPQIWASDESDPAQRMEIQFNTSIGYPLCCIGSHVNDSPVAPYPVKAALALFGTYGYEMDPGRLTQEEIAALCHTAELYRKYHGSVIEQGTLWHLCAPREGNYMAMQCVSRDRSASVVLFMNRQKEWDKFRFVRLKGLSREMRYYNTFDRAVHDGAYYMEVGLNLSRERLTEFDCRLIVLTQA